MKIVVTDPTPTSLRISFMPTAKDYVFTICIVLPGLYLAFRVAETWFWSFLCLFVFGFLGIVQVMPTSIVEVEKDAVNGNMKDADKLVQEETEDKGNEENDVYTKDEGEGNGIIILTRTSPITKFLSNDTVLQFPLSKVIGLRLEQLRVAREKRPAYRLVVGFEMDGGVFGLPMAESFLFGDKFKKELGEKGEQIAKWIGVEWIPMSEGKVETDQMIEVNRDTGEVVFGENSVAEEEVAGDNEMQSKKVK